MKLREGYKSDTVFALLFCMTFIFAFFIMKNIPLFGDDYYYTTFWNNNFWQKHIEHYMLANGRAIVHFLVTVFISLPPILWQILNSLFLALIATFSAKHFASAKASPVVALISLGTLLSLEATVVNQSIYWLTGSFNYVYPFALLSVYWFLLCKKGKKSTLLLYILAFFSAATTEQNGMMTLGVTLLHILDAKFIKKERLSGGHLGLLIPALIGFCSVYLAPATFVRYGLETEKGLLEVIREQLPVLYYAFIANKYMRPFILFTFVSMGLFVFKSFRSFWSRLIVIADFAAICVVFYISRIPQTAILVGILYVTLVLCVNIGCIFTYLIKNKTDGYFVICTAFILAVGSQFMMSASPVWGTRTMLCGIFNLMIFSMGLIASVCREKKYLILSAAVSLVFFICGAKTYSDTYIGYKTNYPVVAQNETLIEDYKAGKSDELVQYKMPYAEHCWSMPYISPYHLHYYKMYYEISEDTDISWVEYDLNVE